MHQNKKRQAQQKRGRQGREGKKMEIGIVVPKASAQKYFGALANCSAQLLIGCLLVKCRGRQPMSNCAEKLAGAPK